MNPIEKVAQSISRKNEFQHQLQSIVIKTSWRKITHFFGQKFRESNVFTKEITKELFWRNIFLVRLNSSFFHTVIQYAYVYNNRVFFNSQLNISWKHLIRVSFSGRRMALEIRSSRFLDEWIQLQIGQFFLWTSWVRSSLFQDISSITDDDNCWTLWRRSYILHIGN